MTLFLASLCLAAFVCVMLAIPRVRIDPLPDIETVEPEPHRIEIPFKAGMPRDSRGRFVGRGK